MQSKENYTPLIAIAAVLTLAILVSFEVYIEREPTRIAADTTRDSVTNVSAGQQLYSKNCVQCHGQNGEGSDGVPSLNDKQFLSQASDNTIFSVVSSGVPGSAMPAWNQSLGGPLTDENVRQLVAFIRAWEPAAPDRRATPVPGNPNRGAIIFNSTCIVCHGKDGVGTTRAPALNDATKLNQFDDAWYKNTITRGRPAQGMPTWGTVLSPMQINDLLALIDMWRANPATTVPSQTLTATISATATPTATAEATVSPTVEAAKPSNPGGPGPAIDLVGDPTAGAQVFVNNCQKCHGPQGTGGVANPGSTDGTVPPLNPIDSSLISSDPKVYATNLDLFLEHGSTPDGTNPQQKMTAFGDEKQLTPQQIADAIAYVMSLNPAPAVSATATPTATAEVTVSPTVEAAKPSNPGGPGPAVDLVGDPTAGAQVFVNNCQKCHGPQGTGGVANPGSTDGTVPPLNPIDSSLISNDPKVYATNLDLFLEHGSTPDGTNPQQKMTAFGDEKQLTPQQIADAIAYVMSLNPAPTFSATATPTATAEVTVSPTVEAARPSNPGGPGSAVDLVGDPTAGAQVFVNNCQKCHGPQGTGGVANPGSTDGTVPPLNPIDSSLISSDPKVYATNLDLFLEHGSTPDGTNPQQKMTAFGDEKQLTPQQIADAIAYVMSLNPAPAVSATATPTATAEVTVSPTVEAAKPSNPGGPGPAVDLVGDPTAGAQVFVNNCQKCHGPQGTGGVANPGSTDGTVPPLNPIDSSLISNDPKVYATNLDLFLEHGSTPDGTNPQQKMTAFGDEKQLTPQQIADAIAYVMSLNPAPAVSATVTATVEVARPSNPGGPGTAVGLVGNIQSGMVLFVNNCEKCHGAQGKGGVANPGSTDGTIPSLNPIDETLESTDQAVFAYNLDLFIEHGSTPDGTNPQQTMPAFGDTQKLTPQQIADIVAYVISLNK